MAAFQPFLPSKSATQSIAIGAGAATSQTIQVPASVGTGANSLLISAAGATAGTVAYVRLSVESSTVIAATATDCPVIFNGTIPIVRLFASPNEAGAYNVAVVVTATPATAGMIWFTPGQGGDV